MKVNELNFIFIITLNVRNYSFIELKLIKGIKDCALVSPYLQQDSPGGYLSSVIAKHHHEAIFKFVFANDFLFSYSLSRICVYRYDRIESRLVFLFDVELPRPEKLREYLGLPVWTKQSQNTDHEGKL